MIVAEIQPAAARARTSRRVGIRMAKKKTSIGRRGFLKNAAAGAAALAGTTPLVEAQVENAQPPRVAGPAATVPPPTQAKIDRETGNIRPPVAVRTITRPASDLMV